jgi:hypothetical protein
MKLNTLRQGVMVLGSLWVISLLASCASSAKSADTQPLPEQNAETQRSNQQSEEQRAESAAAEGAVTLDGKTQNAATQDRESNLEARVAELELMNELLTASAAPNTAPTVKPDEKPMTVGASRVRVAGLVKNSSYAAFLEARYKPDDRNRAASPDAQAIGVAWIDAARYCNWLSTQWQYDEYYRIDGPDVQVNSAGRQNGYRLPARRELELAIQSASLSRETASQIGLLCSEVNRAYRFDASRNGFVPLDGTLPVSNIGFMVVRDEK